MVDVVTLSEAVWLGRGQLTLTGRRVTGKVCPGKAGLAAGGARAEEGRAGSGGVLWFVPAGAGGCSGGFSLLGVLRYERNSATAPPDTLPKWCKLTVSDSLNIQ
jgi:hypothetical protein